MVESLPILCKKFPPKRKDFFSKTVENIAPHSPDRRYFLLPLPFPIISSFPGVSLHEGVLLYWVLMRKYFIFLLMLLPAVY